MVDRPARLVSSRKAKLAILFGVLAAVVAVLLVSKSPNGATAAPSQPFSVIVITGDGLGASQRTATQLYNYGTDETQPMDALTYGGNLRTDSLSPFTDSAASATSMATGVRTKNNHAGVLPGGERLVNLTEEAHGLGKSVGLVSDNDITNATMAGFAAHVEDRDHKRQIARQYLEQTQPEVMFGGGEKIWYPAGDEGKIPDEDPEDKSNNKVNLVEQAKSLGYGYAWDRESLDALSGPKALGLVQAEPYLRGNDIEGYKRSEDPNFVPTPYLVQRALEILDQDPEGFFMAIEVDGLDSAAHEHDGATTILQGQVTNQIVDVIQAYRESNPNVLVVVTGDHETGGLMVEPPSSRSTDSGGDDDVPAFGEPQNQPLPNGKTPKLSGPFKVEGTNRQFKLDWTTPGHTGVMVPVTAAGPGAERLTGVNHNSFVHEVASDVLNGNP